MLEAIKQRLEAIPPRLLIVLIALVAVVGSKFDAGFLFRSVTRLPLIKQRISMERSKLQEKFRKQNVEARKSLQIVTRLPEQSLPADQICALLSKHASLGKIRWDDGNASGCVYTVDDRLSSIYLHALKQFEHFNPLHLDVFPGLIKMEADVARMVSSMFNGDENCVGTVTSGGTESLLLALKTYRDWHKKNRSSAVAINAIAPTTIHPAFLKACQYFCVEPILIPVDRKTKRVQTSKLASRVNDGTCAIFVSAPCFPYGVVDPIQKISRLALEKGGIPVHVDACLGSFVVPFLKHLEPFDFRCPGVTSISCDTHKYGLAPKGTSVVVYRDRSFLENQIYATCNWPGGLYVTANMGGSRSGVLIAACWATLLSIGREGYSRRATALHSACKQLANDLSNIAGISLMAEPETCIVAATCDKCYAFLDKMSRSGWYLSALQDPAGFHIALTELHLVDGRLRRLLQDMKNAIKEIGEGELEPPSDVAVMYGSSRLLPDRSIVEDISKDFVISLYE